MSILNISTTYAFICCFFLFFNFSCREVEKRPIVCFKRYKTLSIPQLQFCGIIEDNYAQKNHVECGYDKEGKLVSVHLDYENETIKDTVVYKNKEALFVEEYHPRYSNDIEISYIVRRNFKKSMVTYWLIKENESTNLSLLCIDSMHQKEQFKRYFPMKNKFKNIYEFLEVVDILKPIFYNSTMTFNFSVRNDTAYVRRFDSSDADISLNYEYAGSPFKSNFAFDSSFNQIVQFQYFYPYILDPFLKHWK